MRFVLVMGGLGFVGVYLVCQLFECGDIVCCLVCVMSLCCIFEGFDVELVEGDLCDIELLCVVVCGCECVFYCVVDYCFYVCYFEEFYVSNVGGM